MEFDEILILEIQKREFLYNKRLKTYRNLNLRVRGWEEIAAATQTEVNACKVRWKTLRDRFCKEAARIPSGSGGEFEVKWPLFHSLMFLKGHIATRQTVGNFSGMEVPCSPEPADAGIFIEVEETAPAETPPTAAANPPTNQPKRKRGEDNIDRHFAALASSMDKFLNGANKKEGKHEAFLKLLANKLDELRPNVVEDKKIEILVWLHNEVTIHKDFTR